jgi:nitrogen fixation protein NifQ
MQIPADIPQNRAVEYEGLIGLLMESAVPGDDGALVAADAIARGSLLDGHLWRAMELGNRDELRAMFEAHFPELAAGNTKDMRWKKYLYKRLCGWPGFHG